ncbi:hypothetical protein OsI_25306 [Oryza sativa Indica Group]|jgi:hypothetical protein|uniref:Uncharacterized protein n=1 Tax=Oryza sativa subsp. indica TaxID=39946 RepID=A2YJ94_ORYSI|nr:hypothetical protein OsI_25306 [Oryza sativa Indica Group]
MESSSAAAASLPEYVQFDGHLLPVAWLEGEVLAEFLAFLDAAAAAAEDAAEPYEVEFEEEEPYEVEFEEEPEEVEFAADDDDDGGLMEDGGRGSEVDDDDSDLFKAYEEEAEQEMALLLPHIMAIPAVMARATAPATEQETKRHQFVSDQRGWM